jgi:hypothetical protein
MWPTRFGYSLSVEERNVLTDRYPATWDTDDYIRAWARARGGSSFPIFLVALQAADNQRVHIAEVHFRDEGAPVHRITRPMATALTA